MKKYFIYVFLIISIIGTLLHFTYKLSNYNFLVGLFSAINESTWEHIKIGLTPLFLFYLFEYLKYKRFNIKSITLSLIVFMSSIIIIFYSSLLIFKKPVTWLNIVSFYLSIFFSLLTYFKTLKNKSNNNAYYIFSLVILIFYFLGSILPPKMFLFKDPITNTYGFSLIHSSK